MTTPRPASARRSGRSQTRLLRINVSPPQTTRTIGKDEELLLDLWGKLDQPDAVFADITWVGYTGRDVPGRIAKAFNAVRLARDAAVDLVQQRTRAGQEIRGFEVTLLGHRHRSEPCIAQEDPRGRPIWWIGAAGAEQDAGPGTDFHSVRMGYISITPIHVDLTRYQALEKVASWVGALEAALPR